MSGRRHLVAFWERMQLRLAVKAGAAASLALFFGVGFSQVMDRPDYLVGGLWTVLTAIVVVQAYLGGTYLAAVVRFLGTLVGAIMGGLCTSLLGANAVSLGVSVFFTIIICSLLGLKESVRIASMTVAVVMVLWGLRPLTSPWLFGFYRFLDSCLGILVAVVVVHTLWPAQATRRIRLNLIRILASLRILFREAIDLENPKKREGEKRRRAAIVSLLRETRSHVEESRIEIRTRSSVEDWVYLLDRLERLYEEVATLSEAEKESVRMTADSALAEEAKGYMRQLDRAFGQQAKMLEEKKVLDKQVNLTHSVEKMTAVLVRFREDDEIVRRFSFQEAQAFFIFFHGLQAIGEELNRLNDRIRHLYRS